MTSLLGFALIYGGFCDGETQEVSNRIETLLQSYVSPGQPGLAVLVVKDGAPIYRTGLGVRDLRSKAALDARTNFRLASFSKQFTAMAIMLLVRDGKLRYDDPVTKVFPDFPAYGKAITIRHLLNHTSGLKDYEELMELEEKVRGPRWSPEHQIRDEEVLALLKGQGSGNFAPGSRWEYSNSGYVLLGLMVAKLSGKPFDEFLAERIFRPLQMSHTVAYRKGKNEISDRAYGHTFDKKKGIFEQTDQSATSATLGDGGIYSNLEDLQKWDTALAKHTLLSEGEMVAALTPAKLKDGSQTMRPKSPDESAGAAPKPVSYGFGWFLDPYKGHVRNWHTGETVGFRTVIERFPQDRLSIIVLANRTDLDPKAIADSIVDVFLEK